MANVALKLTKHGRVNQNKPKGTELFHGSGSVVFPNSKQSGISVSQETADRP